VIHRSASASLLCIAAAGTVLLAAQQPIRVSVDLVNFGVVVTDRRGTLITGLTADDFELLERGKPQRIRFFSAADAALAPPLHLGFLLDASGSMERDIKDVRTAAIKFLNQTEYAKDVTLVDFDTQVRLTHYDADDFAKIIEHIRMRKAEGMTAFYDALGVYLRNAFEKDGQKVLVVYTDGGDTRSITTSQEVVELLKASDVTMYILGYLEHQSSSSRTAAQMEMQRFSNMTGGQAFFPTSIKQLDGTYEKILQEISARYVLGYTSSDEKADGTWRQVEIKLKRPELKGAKLRTRPGYYAPLIKGSAPSP
jgi:Ca-activated chloride channel homolog